VAQSQNAEGVQLFQQGNYQPAMQKFQQALTNDPQNSDAYYNLARTYHRLGTLNKNAAELDQAETLYNLALDRNSNNVDCYRALSVLLVERQRSDDAKRLLDGWAAQSPTSPDPKVELARLAQEMGNREQSKSYLLEALAVDPYNSRALAALGKLHEELGNREQALADYERSLWQDKQQPEVAARIAALRSELGPTVVAVRPPAIAPTPAPGQSPSPTFR
jgi:tetratricopeptide (TPR) repeat protein